MSPVCAIVAAVALTSYGIVSSAAAAVLSLVKGRNSAFPAYLFGAEVAQVKSVLTASIELPFFSLRGLMLSAIFWVYVLLLRLAHPPPAMIVAIYFVVSRPPTPCCGPWAVEFLLGDAFVTIGSKILAAEVLFILNSPSTSGDNISTLEESLRGRPITTPVRCV